MFSFGTRTVGFTFRTRFRAVCVILFFLSMPTLECRAMDRDVRTVLTVGLYGIAAGTLLGALAFPATQDVKSIFLGSSVGLYLGLIVGSYHVHHRNDPQNPLVGSTMSPYLGTFQGAMPKDLRTEFKLSYVQTIAEF